MIASFCRIWASKYSRLLNVGVVGKHSLSEDDEDELDEREDEEGDWRRNGIFQGELKDCDGEIVWKTRP